MKWFLLFTAVVAGLLLVVLVAGLFVPERHRTSVRERVDGSPARVWEVLNEASAFPEWRPGVDGVEVEERGPDGPVRWVETGVTGSMSLEVEEREPPRRLVVGIVEGELPFGGTWTYELEPEAEGTAVTITEEGEIYNPIFRFMAHYILGYDATMRDYLAGLRSRMAGGAEGPGE